jgi:hypothetical protein
MHGVFTRSGGQPPDLVAFMILRKRSVGRIDDPGIRVGALLRWFHLRFLRNLNGI